MKKKASRAAKEPATTVARKRYSPNIMKDALARARKIRSLHKRIEQLTCPLVNKSGKLNKAGDILKLFGWEYDELHDEAVVMFGRDSTEEDIQVALDGMVEAVAKGE